MSVPRLIGETIAITAFAALLAVVLIGLSCDLIRWLDWRAFQRGRARMHADIDRDEQRQLQGDLLDAMWALPAREPEHERRRRGIA